MRFGGKLLRRALVRFALVAALVVLSAASARARGPQFDEGGHKREANQRPPEKISA